MSAPLHKDYAGAKLGMWLFLFTELLLFGGLFILYAVYLHRHPQEFISAGAKLNELFGAANTVLLLTSSLAIAMATSTIQRGRKTLTLWLVGATIAAAGIFMINKYFEWRAKIDAGLYPGTQVMLEHPAGEIAFFSLYYVTTGLHGLHVLIGGALLIWVWLGVANNRIHRTDYVALENSGLYWHLVDLIWIFIFPLYYLII